MKITITATILILLALSCAKTDTYDIPAVFLGTHAVFINATTYEKLAGTKVHFANVSAGGDWILMDSAMTNSEADIEFSGAKKYHGYTLIQKEGYLPTAAILPQVNGPSNPSLIPEDWELAFLDSITGSGGGVIYSVKVHQKASLNVTVKVENPLPPLLAGEKHLLKLELRGRDDLWNAIMYFKTPIVGYIAESLPSTNTADLTVAGNLNYTGKMIIYKESQSGSLSEIKASTKTFTVKPNQTNTAEFTF